MKAVNFVTEFCTVFKVIVLTERRLNNIIVNTLLFGVLDVQKKMVTASW